MCYLIIDHMLTYIYLTYRHLEGLLSISFSHDLYHAAGFKYKCSYLNILQASLLHSSLHDKVTNALMSLQACSLYIHSTTLKGHHLVGIQPKDLDWANHIFSAYGSC